MINRSLPLTSEEKKQLDQYGGDGLTIRQMCKRLKKNEWQVRAYVKDNYRRILSKPSGIPKRRPREFDMHEIDRLWQLILQGHSHKEVAKMLDCTPFEVKKAIHNTSVSCELYELIKSYTLKEEYEENQGSPTREVDSRIPSFLPSA